MSNTETSYHCCSKSDDSIRQLLAILKELGEFFSYRMARFVEQSLFDDLNNSRMFEWPVTYHVVL